MHGNPRSLALGIALAAAVALGPGVAHALGAPHDAAHLAYVDPGSGSFILQALVAALAGVLVAVNAYWRKIKQILRIGAVERDDGAAGAKRSDD